MWLRVPEMTEYLNRVALAMLLLLFLILAHEESSASVVLSHWL
jgi:hypothetical protein